MTTLREAAQQALEALEFNQARWQGKDEAIDALKAALAEPECPHCAPRQFNPNPESELHGY